MNNTGMKQHVRKAAACFLAGTVMISAFTMTAAAAGTSLVGVGEADVSSEPSSEASADDSALVGIADVYVPADVSENSADAEASKEDADEYAQESEDMQETEAAPAEDVINTLAVSQIGEDSCVNIRTAPDVESDIVGKLYNGNAATILGEEGDWYLIQSGNCQGYVAKYLMTTGSAAEEVIREIGTPVAQVNVEALMVRSDASEDAEVVDMVGMDQVVYLEEDLGGWAKVSTSNGYTGYVSADYVSYATYLPQAETVEEEAARIAAEEAAYQEYLAQQEAEYEAYLAQQEAEYIAYLEQQQAEWEEQNQAWIEYLESQGQYADDAQAVADQAYADQAYLEQVAAEAQAAADEAYWSGDEAWAAEAQAYADQAAADAAAAAEWTAQAQADADAAAQQVIDESGIDASQVSDTSSIRQQVVDYALQFVGNPYVWGGTSLTNGADCSGFTQSVMGDNGISINRTAGQQSQGGRTVSLDSIQPGDLLFYEGSGDYGIGHVSMYIGDGQVVHASNSTDGIIVSDIGYRTPVTAKSYID